MVPRKEVAEQRKWDLSLLIKDESEIEEILQKISAKAAQIEALKGKITPKTALRALKLSSELAKMLERIYVYAAMRHDENTADNKYQAMRSKAEMVATEAGSRTAFLNPEISALPSAEIKKMAADPDYKDFDVYLKEILRAKKHILSAKEEKLLNEVSAFSRGFKTIFDMLDNADAKFGKVKDEEGKTIELTHGSYSLLLQNPDQNVRRSAFRAYYAYYQKMLNTIAATYSGNVTKNCKYAKIRGYKSALSRALFDENIPVKVYDNLIEAVRAATPAVHEYVRFRKSALGVNELHMYDIYTPITKGYKLSLGYDEAFALVKKALAPLGKDYEALLNRAYSERWIDVEETENKRSGAYSWGTYESKPYVLLNYQPTVHDVFTIAHELGHSMHSYMSNSRQCYEKAGYVIFVAEIASTVNEVLLVKYLLKDAKGEERKFLLSYYLDMFRTTLFRQTMFAEFEKFAHGEIEAGRPLTPESMNAEYYRLNKAYYGDALVHDRQIALEWARIPHFYNAFYVYKYATGLTSAVNIANKILTEEGYVNKYFEFLSAGGSMDPLEILAFADVDLTGKQPFRFAMKEFADVLEELKKC